MEKRFVHISAVFLFLLFFISPVIYAAEEAGQVIITSGPFQALNADHQSRLLKRGSYFYSGDTLMTGTNATAQVKFSDGSVLALNANSRLRVDEYVYNDDTKTDKSVMTLVKGGFRAITGAISKNNPSAYQVQTPVAVIGVRGTNYGAVLSKGHLYAGVWKDKICVQNAKGNLCLGDSEEYRFTQVLSKDEAPIGLLVPLPELVGNCSFGRDER